VGFAFALMAFGVLQILAGDVIGGFWFILIGMFLRAAPRTRAIRRWRYGRPWPTCRCGTS
jgi:hypothetical protein